MVTMDTAGGGGSGARPPSGARHVTDEFRGAGDVRLYLQAWLPGVPESGDHGAVIAVVHGYGDHGGRYAGLGEAMAAGGLAVYAYDLRGHGRSSGARGQVKRFDDYLDDTELYLSEVRRLQPAKTVFLLGHSMGGLICARLAQERPPDVAGMILSAPFLHLAAEVSPVKILAARILSLLWPGRDIGNTVRASDLSRDEAVVRAYDVDPLVHHVAPARWAVQTLAAQGAAMARADRVVLPLYVLFGTADPVADPGCSRTFFARAGSEDKTLREYPGLLHECFNELGRERVYADLAAWTTQRTPD